MASSAKAPLQRGRSPSRPPSSVRSQTRQHQPRHLERPLYSARGKPRRHRRPVHSQPARLPFSASLRARPRSPSQLAPLSSAKRTRRHLRRAPPFLVAGPAKPLCSPAANHLPPLLQAASISPISPQGAGSSASRQCLQPTRVASLASPLRKHSHCSSRNSPSRQATFTSCRPRQSPRP